MDVLANPLLNAPALRGLIDLGTGGASFPLNLPVTFGADFQRYATEDIPSEPPLAGTYLRRLVDEPQVTLALSNDRAGVQESEEIAFTLSNTDGALNVFFTQEVLTALVRYHLYDRETRELQENLFVGLLSAFEAELDVIHCRAVRMNVALLNSLVPRSRVTVAEFPLAPAAPVSPSGGIGSVIATGIGVGKRIPGRKVRAPRVTADDTGEAPLGLTDPDFHDFDIGKGNLTIDRVWASGLPVDQDISLPDEFLYEVLYREYRPQGTYGTALRFRQNLAQGISTLPVTVDVRRESPDFDDMVAGEWKWNGNLLESVTGTAAMAYGDVSPASCVTGPSGIGLGALLFDGLDDYVDLPGSFQAQTFTFETWVFIQPNDHPIMVIASAPGIDRTTDLDSGWYLDWEAADENVRFGVFIQTVLAIHEVQVLTAANSCVPNAWHQVVVTCDAKAGQVRIFVDGIEQSAGMGDWGSPFTVHYRQAVNVPMACGRPFREVFTTQWLSGKLGWTRYSGGVARDLPYVARAYWLMRRNPLEFLRELFTDELGDVINPTTWDQATRDLDSALTANGGELKADGFLTTEATAQAVIEAFLPFRDLRFWRDPNGLLEVGFAQPVTQVVAQFGIGDQFANIVSLNRRSRPSLAEAIQTLPIKYRWQRDENGTPRSGDEEFEQEVEASVLPIGKRAEPLLLPFVYSRVTAEAIRQWEEGRRRARAEVLEITVGHEGRRVVPGQVVRIAIDTHAVSGVDYEVVRATPKVTTRDLVLSPYSASVFNWTAPDPATLPAEPTIDTGLRMDIGANPSIAAIRVAPGRYQFDILLVDSIRLPKVALGGANELPYLVGGTDRLVIFFDLNDETYGTTNVARGQFNELFRFDASVIEPGTHIRSMKLEARFQPRSPADYVRGHAIIAQVGTGGLVWAPFAPSTLLLAEGFVTHPFQGTRNPFTGRAWETGDLLSLEFGVRLDGSGDLADLQLYAETGRDYPVGFSHAKLWLLGPSDDEPDPPTVDSIPTAYGRDLFHYPDGLVEPATLEPGQYWAYARLYDVLGRPSALIGPNRFDVDGL